MKAQVLPGGFSFETASDLSLVQAADASGIELPTSCRNGTCRSCLCRLVDGHVTFVHRRLWPALVRMAAHFKPRQLAQVRQEHTASGRHVNRETTFPKWVPQEILEASQALSEAQARSMLGSLVGLPSRPAVRSRRRQA